MLNYYEKELFACGWISGIPYWDWTRDYGNSAKFFASPLFDPVLGFGGNGDYVPGDFDHPAPGMTVGPPWDIPDRTGGGCIKTGPFKNWKVHVGPATSLAATTRCVRRDFAPVYFNNATGNPFLQLALTQADYGWFARQAEFFTHSGGHIGIGGLYGDMSDVASSRECFPPVTADRCFSGHLRF